MRVLIVEDDLTSRKYLYKLLSNYGECDLVIDGLEAIDAFMMSIKDENPYDLICLDIMMPKVDGVRALKSIRNLEKKKGITPEKKSKIIMTTVLGESDFVKDSFDNDCDAYVPKPIDSIMLIAIIRKLGLIKDNPL